MKVVTTQHLKKMLARSRRLRYNRVMDKRFEKLLDPNGKHVLSQWFIHNDDVDCIRCGLALLKLKDKSDPYECALDFHFEDYTKLPEYTETPQ